MPQMPNGQDKQPFLSSWKEIGAYLKVSPRTAQSWERDRALPIRRHDGERGRVYAQPDEIDRWLAGKPSEIEPPKRRRTKWWWVFGAATVIFFIAASLLLAFRPGAPARVRVEDDAVIVLDHRDRECWRHHFNLHFDPNAYLEPDHPRAWVGDLDGDGVPEVLFATYLKNALQAGSELVCFNAQGDIKWRFRPGRAVRSTVESFSPAFLVMHVVVFGDFPRRIVLNSVQIPYYANQTVVLSGEGNLQGEYWHSGAITALQVQDLDGDAIPDIILGGTSNSYRKPTLIVLDSRDVAGASQETEAPDYQLQGFTPGREKLRILFPQLCLNRRFNDRSGIDQLSLIDDEIVAVALDVRSLPLYYHFTHRGKLKKLVVADYFRAKHAELHAAGQLDHPFSPAEQAALSQVTYLKGADWTR